jgi:TetR/AcrR family transcriptional repressor of mexJK operon
MTDFHGPDGPRDRTKFDPDAILDAGWDLFLDRGLRAVSIERLAAIARVSKITVYRHFSEKHFQLEMALLRQMLPSDLD